MSEPLSTTADDGATLTSYWGPSQYDRYTVYTAITGRPWHSPGVVRALQFTNYEPQEVCRLTPEHKDNLLANAHRSKVRLYNSILRKARTT